MVSYRRHSVMAAWWKPSLATNRWRKRLLKGCRKEEDGKEEEEEEEGEEEEEEKEEEEE